MTDSNDSNLEARRQQPIVSPFIPYDRVGLPGYTPSGSPLEPFPPFLPGLLPYSPPVQRFLLSSPYAASTLELPVNIPQSPIVLLASSANMSGRAAGVVSDSHQVRYFSIIASLPRS